MVPAAMEWITPLAAIALATRKAPKIARKSGEWLCFAAPAALVAEVVAMR
jgi:hypothetical protein